MTELLFIRILNMSLTGSFVILAVLAVRFLLRRLPRIFSYCLWAVVLFRLLCPVSFPASFSPFTVLKAPTTEHGRIEYISEDLLFPATGQDQQLQTPAPAAPPQEAADNTTKTAASQASKSMSVIACLWLSGVCAMTFYSTATLFRLKRKLKTAVQEADNVYVTDQIHTPFVMGLLRPRIYLPPILNLEERSYILLHEQIHLKRRDHIVKMISFIALCLHWFNPLVWIAFFLCGKDMEMSCDEAVIRRLGSGVKKQYSTSLLHMATGRRIVSGIPLSFGEGETGSRIKNILRYKKPAALVGGIAAAACAVTVFVLLANPSADHDTEDPSEDKMQADENVNLTETEIIMTENLAKIQAMAMNALQAEREAQEALVDSLERKTLIEQQTAGTNMSSVHTEGKLAENGIYLVSARSVDPGARTIDSYVAGFDPPYDGEEAIAFAEDCVCYVNYSMTAVKYEEVPFDTFAALIGSENRFLNKPCILYLENGLIAEAYLESAYGDYGISFDPFVPQSYYYDFLIEEEGEDVFNQYYTLIRTESLNISDRDGIEQIEVYTGNAGDGDSGIVLFKDAQGELLYVQDAHVARAEWNNIYMGKNENGAYLMNVYIEDRWDFGGYGYWVYRLGADGGIRQIAGSRFDFELNQEYQLAYDDDLFREWVADMDAWLQDCTLLLSTQEGEVRTDKTSDIDRYNYDTLNVKDRALY